MFKNLVLQMHRELITGSGGGTTTSEEAPSNPGSESELLQNQNPSNPPAPPIDPAYVARLEASIKQNEELAARNAEIMRRMEERLSAPAPTSNPAPQPAKKTADELNKEYYENPGTFVTNRIEEALERTVKPLNDFVNNFQSTDKVDGFIREVKSNPKLAAHWDAQVEEAVRKQLAPVPVTQLNIQLVQQAAINAIGLKALGVIGTPNPTPNPVPPSNQEPPVTTPPNVRPSNPPAPNTRPAKVAPVLTENERRMARENRQTPEEFVFWRDLPADQVMTRKWDKTKNEEAK